MDDLLAEFVAETREMLQAIEGEIVAWEADPADRERLDAIFRFVHTVKGNCGFFDFPRLEKLSHAAESVLSEVRADRRTPDAAMVTAVLAIIDRIGEMIDAIEAGGDLPAGGDEALIAALDADGDEPGADAPRHESDSEPKATRRTATARSIRLPVELLDNVMSGVSDMVLARNELARRLRESGADPTLEGPFERLSAILDGVREGATRMRMQRLEHLFNALPRLVRDLSSELGKQVLIDLEGGDVELDREMIETVRDPLTHLIRNAIDHGLETPAQRQAAGKREIGLVTVSARRAGNKIAIAVSDDGRGLALDRICAKAVAAGIVSEAEAAALDDQRKLELIFAPGLSTAEAVSQVSGRGVGMDVVRANIERIGGKVSISSKQGEGTIVFLYLPLTLSIVEGLTVRIGATRIALPRSYIVEIARAGSRTIDVDRLGDGIFLTFRGERVPCLDLAEVLGLAEQVELARATFVFLRLVSGELFALAVDRVLDNVDLVLKPLSPPLADVGLYGGAALLDDGTPILKLDIPLVAERHALTTEVPVRRHDGGAATGPVTVPERQFMLFLGMDGRRRAMRLEPVRHIHTLSADTIEAGGAQPVATVDGRILPLLGAGPGSLGHGAVTALRLSDGTIELLYAVERVLDSVGLSGAVTPVAGDDTLEGTALFDGTIVGVVDAHRLFAAHSRSVTAGTGRPTCRVPLDDAWARAFLEPLIVGAGYEVLGPEDRRPADVSVILEGDDRVEDAPAAGVIRLSARPCGEGGSAIYRYDREAVIAALGQARAGER